MFNTRFRYGYILILAGYSYVNTSFTEVQRYYPVPGTKWTIAGVFLLLTLIIWEGDRGIDRWITNREKRRPYPRQGMAATAYPLALGFTISILFAAGVSGGVAYTCVHLAYPAAIPRLPILVKLMITLGTRINLFLYVVHTIFCITRELGEKHSEAETLRRANAQAQLQAIQSQVNPHFLFNNLNVLSALILQERPEANKFIEEFSIVYRHVLSSQRRDLVPLAEELSFLDHYLFLLNQRFPRSIEILIEVDAGLQDWLVVPMALQMLIENAIKHNVVSSEYPLKIYVRTEVAHRLVVENRVRPKTPIEASTRTGLSNIDQRYALITRQHINIVKTEEVFSVSLPLIRPAP